MKNISLQSSFFHYLSVYSFGFRDVNGEIKKTSL